jgi:hypothetical protein
MMRFLFAVLLASGAAGCAHEYAYWPAAPGAPNSPAVRYPIPPEAPRGEVYVTSFGFTQMDVADDRTAEPMHARLVTVNNGPEPWTLDGREQQLLIAPGQPMLSPAFANSDAGAGPLYEVPPGQRRVFDFYYDVPAPLNDPRYLGSFELVWRISVGGRVIAERTPFQRFESPSAVYDPYPNYVFVGLGWGGMWWHGPHYPFIRPPIIRTYYYPPARVRTYGPWRGAPRTAPPPGGGWRGSPRTAPPAGGGWRGSPPGGGGGWRGSPPGGGGGWRGTPRMGPSSGGGWRGSPRTAPSGGGFRGTPGGGGFRGGRR